MTYGSEPLWWVGVRCADCGTWVNLSQRNMTKADRALVEPLLDRCAPPFIERLPGAFHTCVSPILRWEWQALPNPNQGCEPPPQGR